MQDLYDGVAEGREVFLKQLPFAEVEHLQIREIDFFTGLRVESVSKRDFYMDHVLSPFRDDVRAFLLDFLITHQFDLLLEVYDRFSDLGQPFLLFTSERLSVSLLELQQAPLLLG